MYFDTAVGRTLIEIPAGTLDRVESLHDAASRNFVKRQAIRQTLYKALVNSGCLLVFYMKNASLCAKGCEGIGLEPNESIEPRVVQWSEAVAMCSGLIEDAKTVAAIFLADNWLRS